MTTPKKKRPKPKPAVAKSRRRPRKAAKPVREAPPPPVEESAVVESLAPEPEPVVAFDAAPEPELPLSSPEVLFAERVEPAEPERPHAANRRAIFFDVENTSRAQHIARVIDHLQIDRRGHRTEFFAVGNWRVIGHDTARLLARHGAHLVHSAPSVGVRDWSDLRIAVAAGAWLAAARPGDVLEIVSDDRAFDAVGDVAAMLGIMFRRLSYRGLVEEPVASVAVAPAPEHRPAPEPRPAAPSGDSRGHRPRGRYRDRRERRHIPPQPQRVEPAPVPRPEVEPAGEEPHTAPHDEIVAVVKDLIRANPSRAVSIDTVANALKARGFSRPPGSPRLITRLRRLKELELSRAGLITLVDSASASSVSASAVASAPVPVEVDPSVDDEPPSPGNELPPPEPEPADFIDEEDDGPQPGNQRIDVPQRPTTPDDAANRRRRRRGGRRRRGRGRPQPTAAP
jgi:hypothetical protein